MKLIDEKGKIFGLVNVVDFFIGITLILVLVIVGSRVIKNKDINQVDVTGKKEAYITLYANSVVPEVVDTLKAGDKLVANNAYTTGEIVSIKVEPAAYITTNSEGKALLSKHPIWKDIYVVIKDTVNVNSPILKAGGQEVRVNYPFILKTQQFESNTKVRSIEFKEISK